MKIFKNVSILSLAIASVFGFSGTVAHAATSPTLVGSSSYSILSGAGATNTGITTISGDVGVSPNNTYTENGATTFQTPANPHLNDAPAIAAQADNLSAFGFLDAGTNADANCIGGVLPSGTDLTTLSPLAPGLYCSAGTFLLTGNLTLTGTTGTWVFKTVSGLTTSAGSSVTGGDACNIWWRVGSTAILGTTTSFRGNILASTSVVLQTGATLNGRAFAYTAATTLDANTISGPTCTAPLPSQGTGTGTINVVKTVINDNGGTKVVSDFPLFVNGTSVDSGVTNSFRAPASVYTVTETSDSNYTRTFSGDCDVNGQLNLSRGDNKFCIITNNDIGAPVVPPVPPLIDVVKTALPLSLPAGPGPVTYTYTLRNIGTVPVTDITMVGDTCSPIVRVSGDTDNDNKLDLNETWVHTCSTTLQATHTNTVVATGWANGISAVDIASATVVVGIPIVPPIIHVTKIPNPLTLSAKGGIVTYTNRVTNPGTVALSNVRLSDNKCTTVRYVSGDTNNDSKLDVSETWIYTCQQNLTKTTTNTITASGDANGLTARDFAIATVVVAAPSLPKTGLSDNADFGQQVRTIANSLGKGSKGNDVMILQQFLISQDKGSKAKALGVVGATSNFGILTKAALAEWQEAVGITPALGNFGSITRAYLKAY